MNKSTGVPSRPECFAHTAAALFVYDAHATARQRLWDGACSKADVEAAEAAEVEALTLLRTAFHADTHHLNSLEHCLHTDVSFLRKCAAIDDEEGKTLTLTIVRGHAVPFSEVQSGQHFFDLETHLTWVRRDGNEAECVDEVGSPAEPFEDCDEVVLSPSL